MKHVRGHYRLTDSDGFLADLRRIFGVETVAVMDSDRNVVQMNLLRGPATTNTPCDPPHSRTSKRH